MPERDYSRLDETLHSRIRLAAASALMGVEEAEFTWLRDAIGATDGNLSTHMRKLEEAGYVKVRKTFAGRRPATFFSLSPEGREAFARYVEELAKFTGIPGSGTPAK
jgi:DNA-binding MarR family transcriptional regulator